MKVRDYVRTEYGISKIKGIYPQGTLIFIETDNGLGNCSCSEKGKLRKGIAVLKENYRNFIDNNVKQELIDLIEVGDYINGSKVTSINNNKIINNIKYENGVYTEDTSTFGESFWKEEDIKSIVTKEQFESMEYKVGE